jgi:hypothetical protein
MDGKWWSKFFIGFVITFVITFYKDKKMVSLTWQNLNNFIGKGSIFILICSAAAASLGICFDLFNTIYCDDDSETENDNDKEGNNKESQNKGKEKEDIAAAKKNDHNSGSSQAAANSHQYSGSVDKGIVKEAVEGVIEGIGNFAPGVIGSLAGAKLGSAIIKSTNLPPLQKAGLGVLTAASGAAGIILATNSAKNLTMNLNKKYEKSKTDSERLLSMSQNSDTDTDTDTDIDISSILEYGDEISPLQALLNNEIAILLLIIIHMVIILLVLFNKFYVSGSLNLISKLLTKSSTAAAALAAAAVKFEKYKIMLDKLGNRFLNILLVINVVFILAYILLLLYINIKLSCNLDDFIDVHNDMKKGISLLLFINSKFLLSLDNKQRNKWYNLYYFIANARSSSFARLGVKIQEIISRPSLAVAFCWQSLVCARLDLFSLTIAVAALAASLALLGYYIALAVL